jgi:acyl carrier protein
LEIEKVLFVNLESLLAEVLDCDAASLSESSGRATHDRWDSLAHLNVIAAVEETYDVALSSADMRDCNTVGLLRSFLSAKGIAA